MATDMRVYISGHFVKAMNEMMMMHNDVITITTYRDYHGSHGCYHDYHEYHGNVP